MATIKGKGVVFGITTSGFKFTAIGQSEDRALSVNQTAQTLRLEAEINKYKDADGDDVGAVVYNQTKRLTLECYPVASDGAIDTGSGTGTVTSAAANDLPQPGEKCVITEPGSGGDTEIAGNYMVENCEKSKSNTEIATFTLELTNSATNDYSADTPAS